MLIAIDIGNTNIKAGKIFNNKLIEFFSYKEINDAVEYIRSNSTTSIAVSSVVPGTAKQLEAEVKKILGIPPFMVLPGIKTNLSVLYKTPETLGIDRLCSAEGAFFLFKNSKTYKTYHKHVYILSIDLGTATTINIIEYPGKFIGGLIAPGLEMMFESLNNKTAQLPKVSTSNYGHIIGTDTNTSIASGVLNSSIGLIEKTINKLKEEFSAKEVIIYLTGGNAKKIIPYLNFDFNFEEGLVLYGINALCEVNK